MVDCLLFLVLAVPGGKKYAVLESLDLICDTPEEQKLWYHTLRQFISPKFHLYSSQYESTDPMIMYPITVCIYVLADWISQGYIEDIILCYILNVYWMVGNSLVNTDR